VAVPYGFHGGRRRHGPPAWIGETPPLPCRRVACAGLPVRLACPYPFPPRECTGPIRRRRCTGESGDRARALPAVAPWPPRPPPGPRPAEAWPRLRTACSVRPDPLTNAAP